jgi:hypothetical protein
MECSVALLHRTALSWLRAVIATEAEYSLLLSDDYTIDVTMYPRFLIGPTRSLRVLLSQMQMLSSLDAILSPEDENARFITQS